jgi:hypothetical protein
MIQGLGPVRQLGYVVRDIEHAMAHWAGVLGIGPWFYIERVPVEDFTCRGSPSDASLSIALANSGPLQIELIQQRNDAPSLYLDFLQQSGEGLQHIAFWSAEFDADLARLTGAGYAVAQSGRIGKRGRFAYTLNPAAAGNVVELSEVSGGKGRFFAEIAAAAQAWDGSDPIRRL